MKNNNQHNHKKLNPAFLEQFPETDRQEIDEIWKLSGESGTSAKLSASEIEEALENVHMRLRVDGEFVSTGEHIAGWMQRHSRILVAAVALFAVINFFFFASKTATVPFGEIAAFDLPDGSSIEMNSGTTIRYSRLFPFVNRNVEINGEAFFTIAEHSNPFIIETNGAVIEVTGTRFNVRSWRDEPTAESVVTVSEGQVLFYPAHNKSNRIILNKNESSFWNDEMEQPSPPESIITDDVTAWRELRFVFQDKPIHLILKDMERRFDVEIQLEVPEVAANKLTAYYSPHVHVETILDDICTVKGLRYTKTTHGYRIFDASQSSDE